MKLTPSLALDLRALFCNRPAVLVDRKAAHDLAIVVLTGLDAVLSVWRGALEGKFRTDAFLTGFVANALIATLLSYLRDKLSVNLFFCSRSGDRMAYI